MPAITDITVANRVVQVLQALQLQAQGKNQEEACAIVGISTDTFQRMVDEHDEGIQAFQQMIIQDTRHRLAMVLIAQRKVLEKIISDATETFTKPSDRLTILRYLDRLADTLALEARVGESTDEAAREILGSGPQLQPGLSRLSVSVQVDVSTQPESRAGDVIDAETLEPQSPSEYPELPALADLSPLESYPEENTSEFGRSSENESE